MGKPKQRTMWTARQDRPAQQGFVGVIGISFLLLFSGCAQLDQLLGKQPDDGKSTPPAQATEPVSKPVAKKKTVEPHPSSVAPATGVAKQPEPTEKQSEQDKILAEKEQLLKEKKSRVASDKKSKKTPKSQAELQPPTEDVFLPPIPLPSKPAAIGGSGG